MSTVYSSEEVRINTKALDAFLLAKGLIPRSLKWSAVRYRHLHKFKEGSKWRTPTWADMDAIRAIYTEARRLTKETGVEHHVDHDYPLQGVLVSGLHVHNNLRILTGAENSRKKNRFEVET